MTMLKRVALLVVVFAMAIAGCSSDDDTPADTGGNTDTTAPSVSSVTPIDGNHIDVVFSENVTRTSAEQVGNYIIVEQATPLSFGGVVPGDTLVVDYAALDTDNRTVSLTTSPMVDAPYQAGVTGVSDVNGNRISTAQNTMFTGTTAPDVTAPTLVYRSPGPGATGVGLGQPVVIGFSELVDVESVTWTSTGGDVPFEVSNEDRVVLQPEVALTGGTVYTVAIRVNDQALNSSGDVMWSFTTTNTVDTTPPRVTSSTPAHLATNVGVNTNLSLTFSEPINQFYQDIQVSPEVSDGVLTWSNSGRTLTYDPDLPLDDDTQYTVTILPDGIRDLAGNGNADVVNIVFTTGSALATGRITGTIAGDPTSNFAADPSGATAFAAYPFPFASDDFTVFGTSVVADNDTYNIPYLDGILYVIAAFNTNGDGDIDPSKGDAIGAYGADISVGDFEPDSVTVMGGTVAGIDFSLFDPSAIAGTITYDGIYAEGSYSLYIGVFDVVGFDPQAPPAWGTTASWPFDREWSIDELDDGLDEGSYYVAAFLDIGGNSVYDPGTDPAGIYGGVTPTAIQIANGSDAVGLVVALEDPAPGSGGAAVAWPKPAHRAPWLERWSALLRQQAMAPKR